MIRAIICLGLCLLSFIDGYLLSNGYIGINTSCLYMCLMGLLIFMVFVDKKY